MSDTPKETPDDSADDADYDGNWLDREAAKKLSGIYANRIFVQPAGDTMLRLNFGEILDDYDPTYHTAVVISAENAKAFAELIYRMARHLTGPPPPVVTPSAPSSAEDENGQR